MEIELIVLLQVALTLSCAKRRFLNFPFITEFVDGYIRQEGGGGSKQKLG